MAERLNMLQKEAKKAEETVSSYTKNLEEFNKIIREKGLKYGPAVEPENMYR